MATTETKPRSQFVAFDEYVDVQLARTRSTIRSTDVLTALVGASTVLMGYLLLFVLVDHWIGTDFLPSGLRLAFGFTVVLCSAAWLVWRVLLPARRRISTLFVAKELESSEPELRSNLLNLVDLKHADRPVASEVLNSIEKRAAVGLSRTDIDSAVDRRMLMKASYLLLAIVVVACVYMLFQPKPVGSSLLRAFGSSAAVPTRVRIDSVIVRVAAGDDPAAVVAAEDNPRVPARFKPLVTAVIAGTLESDERVTLYYSTADEGFVDQPLQMRPADDSLGTLHSNEYSVRLIGDKGLGLLQNVTFYIIAGDAKTETFTIDVLTGASSTVESIDLSYPAYMQLEPETRDGGHINAWEGTTVTLHARASRPVRSARLVFTDTENTSQRAEETAMIVTDGTRLSATWKLAFRSDDHDDYPHIYRIICRDKQGTADLDPTLYNITIRPDVRPTVELLAPVRDTSHPVNATVPLLVKAKDPDFQLRYLKVRIRKDGKMLRQHVSILDTLTPSFGPRSIDFPLAPLNLRAGDQITYWIEALDNKLPAGNRTNSSPEFTITILEPVSTDEARKQHDTTQQEQKEQAEADREQDGNSTETSTDNPMSGGKPQDSASPPDTPEDGQGTKPDPASGSKPKPGDDPPTDPPSDPGTAPKGKSDNKQGSKNTDNRKQQDSTQPGEQGTDPAEPKPDSSQENSSSSDKPGEPLQTDGSDDDEALKRIRDRLNRPSEKLPKKTSSEPKEKTSDNENPTNPDEREAPNAPKSDPRRPGTKPGEPKSSKTKQTPGEQSKDSPRKTDADKKSGGKSKSTSRSPQNKNQKPSGKNPPTKNPTDPSDSPSRKSGDPGPGETKKDTKDPTSKSPNDGKPGPKPGQDGKKGDKSGRGKSKSGRGMKKGAGDKKSDSSDPKQKGDNGTGKPKSSGKPGGSKPSQKSGKPGEGSAGKNSTQGSGGDAPKAGRKSPSDNEPKDSDGGSGPQSEKPDSAEPVKEEFTREAANLVLRRIRDELKRGEVDSDLLKELGWTEKDMRKFADRLKQQVDTPADDKSPQAVARRRQFEELLKSVNVPSRGARRDGRAQRTRKTEAINASDLPVPLQFREAVKLYRRNLTRRKNTTRRKPPSQP